jgi:chromosome segregation ATPase
MSEETSSSLIKHQLEQEKQRNQEYKAKINSLNEIISDLKVSSFRLEKESSELRHANLLLTDDQAKSKREIRDLQTIISRFENKASDGLSNSDGSVHGNMKLLLSQKDELLRKYNEILSQHESLKLQYSNTLSRHKEKIQQSKSIEVQMNEEAERLTREVKSLHNQWLTADAERKRYETLYKTESSESSITITKLKYELEKLQRDLSVLVDDKETVTRENENYISINKNLQHKIQQLEHSLKAAAVQDRSKSHHELIHYESQLSSLQQEKHSLQYELESEKQRYSELDSELGKQKEKYKNLNRDFYQKDEIIDRLQASISTLEANLKKSTKSEAELKAELILLKNNLTELRSENDMLKSTGASSTDFADASVSGSEIQQKIEMIKSLENQYDDLLYRYNQALQSIETFKQKESSMGQEIDQLLERNDSLSTALTSLRSQHDQALQEIDQFNLKHNAVLGNLHIASDRVKELESFVDGLQKQNSSLESDQQLLKKSLDELESQQARFQAEIKQRESAISSLEARLQSQIKHFDDLEASSGQEISYLKQSVFDHRQSIQQLNQKMATMQADQEQTQHDHELAYINLQSSSNKTIQKLMDEVQALDRLLQTDRTKYSTESTSLHEKSSSLERSLRMYEQRCEELEELLLKEKSSSALKELQWEQAREKLTSDLQHRDMSIHDVIAERDAFMSKVKTLKESCRAAEAKARMLEATSTSSAILSIFPTNMNTDMPALMSVPLPVVAEKIKQTPEKRSAELVTVEEENEDVDSLIAKTQRVIEKKSKIASANNSGKDTATYQHAADAALALVSSAYEKQQTSSPAKPQLKENIPSTQNLESTRDNNSSSSSLDKKQNTFRDRLSRSIRAASNALK